MTRPIRNLTASPSESTTDTGPELDAPEWWRVELQVAEAVGQLMEFWGFKRQMGRLWTVLFLSPDPLDVAALTERLQMSSSAVSLSLAELATWGAVRKTWVTGERRDFYSVEPRVWRLVRQVVERRGHHRGLLHAHGHQHVAVVHAEVQGDAHGQPVAAHHVLAHAVGHVGRQATARLQERDGLGREAPRLDEAREAFAQ